MRKSLCLITLLVSLARCNAGFDATTNPNDVNNEAANSPPLRETPAQEKQNPNSDNPIPPVKLGSGCPIPSPQGSGDYANAYYGPGWVQGETNKVWTQYINGVTHCLVLTSPDNWTWFAGSVAGSPNKSLRAAMET